MRGSLLVFQMPLLISLTPRSQTSSTASVEVFKPRRSSMTQRPRSFPSTLTLTASVSVSRHSRTARISIRNSHLLTSSSSSTRTYTTFSGQCLSTTGTTRRSSAVLSVMESLLPLGMCMRCSSPTSSTRMLPTTAYCPKLEHPLSAMSPTERPMSQKSRSLRLISRRSTGLCPKRRSLRIRSGLPSRPSYSPLL